MEPKPIFLSVTFWGVVVALVAGALKKYGWTIDEAGLTNDLVSLAGAIAALYGRWRASQPVHVAGIVIAPKQGGFVQLAFLPWLMVVAFVVALYGCGQMTIHPASQENVVKDPVKATQNLIDEANAGLTAAYTTVLNGVVSGAMTRAEGKNYQLQLDRASGYIDDAAVFLDSGDITNAQGQIKLANSIVAIVQSKLIAMKQKEQ